MRMLRDSLLLVKLDAIRNEYVASKIIIDRLHVLKALVHVRELVTASMAAHDMTSSCTMTSIL